MISASGQDGRMFTPYGPMLNFPQTMTPEQALILRNHIYKASLQSISMSGYQSGGQSVRYHPYGNISKLRQSDTGLL